MKFLAKANTKYQVSATSGHLYLESVSSEIYEDDYNEGEGKHTGAGMDVKVGKKFKDQAAMIKYLADHYGLSEKIEDYDTEGEPGTLQTSRQVADHSDKQNGGWMDPTDAEIKQWKEGKLMLYVENFFISFHTIA